VGTKKEEKWVHYLNTKERKKESVFVEIILFGRGENTFLRINKIEF
jgi:hypothetical protein